MGYGIIRVAKRSARPSVRGMLRHALREDAPPNALEGAPKPEVLAGDRTSGAALARLSATLKAAPRVQKNTVQALDFLVTASRDDMLSWSKDRQDAYFRAALGYIAARFGGIDNVLAATVHRDESTPHMQVLVMPRDPATGSFRAAKMLGGPAGLKAMHDEFHQLVGKEYGLLRGERGQFVEHVPIRQFYAQLAKAGQPLPDYQEVPNPPTLRERLAGKSAEIERKRLEAIEHNKRVRAQLAAAAKVARQVHPAVISRQAERYREAVRLADVTGADRADAQKARADAQDALRRANSQLVEVRAQVQAADAAWTKSGAQILDRWTKSMDPAAVARVAGQLGIELVPGRPLLDQMRRQGRGRTLVECAALLDRQLDGHQVTERRSGEAPTPRP